MIWAGRNKYLIGFYYQSTCSVRTSVGQIFLSLELALRDLVKVNIYNCMIPEYRSLNE